MPSGNKDYYKILQVDPSADPEVLEVAYKRLARKYHPDTNRAPDATLRMQELNAAYGILRDPIKRAQYDRDRFSSSLQSDSKQSEERRKKQEAETTQHRPEAEQQQTSFSYIICPKCNDENPGNSWHCINCGQSLRAKKAQPQREKAKAARSSTEFPQQPIFSDLVCPKCNETNPRNSWYCVMCGQNLRIKKVR